MDRRRALIARASQGSGDLPSGYTRLNYLENTGTQYINTNIIFKVKPKVVTSIYITTTDDRDIFGTLSSSVGCFIIDYWDAVNGIYYRYSTTNFKLVPLSRLYGRWATAEFSDRIMIDNVQYYFTDTFDFSSNTQTFYMFRGRNISSLRISDTQLYDDDILVRNFIPALDPNNTPCMYDTVTKTPFYNAGTGDFLYG